MEGLNLIMDGLTSWATQANYYQSSHEKGRLVSTQVLILDHPDQHLKTTTRWTRHHHHQNKELFLVLSSFLQV